MSGEQNWRPDVSALDYFGQQSKRAQLADRRPVIRRSGDLVWPGIPRHAIRLTDFGDPLALFNGFFCAAPGAASAPNVDDTFVGHVVSDVDLGGLQRFKSLETGYTYERSFLRPLLAPEFPVFTAWLSDEPLAAGWWLSTAQSLADVTAAVVKFDTDLGGSTVPYEESTGVFTIPRAGRWLVNYAVGFAGNAAGVRYLYLRKNGSSQRRTGEAGNAAFNYLNDSMAITLAVDDEITIQAYQTSGASLNITGDANRSTTVDLTFLG